LGKSANKDKIDVVRQLLEKVLKPGVTNKRYLIDFIWQESFKEYESVIHEQFVAHPLPKFIRTDRYFNFLNDNI